MAMAQTAADARARMQRLPPEVTRILYVRNLPFKLSSEEMYDIFGKFGPIRQVSASASIVAFNHALGREGGREGAACVRTGAFPCACVCGRTGLLLRLLPWPALLVHAPIVFLPPTQIRVGAGNEQRGKAFVVYEDIYDAKAALEHLNGFNVCGRYLVR